MANAELGTVVRHLRRLAALRTVREMTDGQLLHDFMATGADTAFAALVKRHGPLVLAVCRRVLNHSQDAEDAFQATFLVLAQSAASIRKAEGLASWLHGVAYRIALKARRDAARRRAHEKEMKAVPPNPKTSEDLETSEALSFAEVRVILDEEIQRLPERYRAVFVLCCLEGKNRAEVAKELGLKEGTVRSRLWQARQQLQQRLARRGVTLSTLLAVAALSEGASQAAVPAALTAATVHSALLFVGRYSPAVTALAPSPVSAKVAALAKGATRAMLMTKVKVTVLVLAASFVAAGAGVLAQRGSPAQLAPQAQTDSARLVVARSPSIVARSPDRTAGWQGQETLPQQTEKQVRTDLYGDPLPASAIARVGTARLRQGSQIYCIAFSPDGRLIASGSYHGDLCLWDRATGKLVRRLTDPSKADSIHWVTAVAFSPDGKILASNKGKARLWEVRSGKLLSDLDRNLVGAVGSMPFSPDGKTLVLGTQKGIRLYDLATGKVSQPIPGYTAPVTAGVFSKNGKVLASGSTDKTARIWDLVTGQETHRFAADDRVVDVALAPDGQLLAAQTTKEVFLWEVATGKEAHRFQAERSLRSLAFSPDGTRLASANTVWDVTTRKEVCRLEGLPSTGLAWGHDDKTLVPVTGGLGPHVTGALAFAPDGKVLASGGCDGVVRLHDPATGKELPPAGKSRWNRGTMAACGFAPDGCWLAVRDHGGIHLCETASGKEIHRLPMEDDYGVSVAFPPPVALAPDGRTVVAAGAKAIYRWDTATGKELGRTLNPRKWKELGPTAALAFAPDGRTFACAHYEPTIRLWDTITGKQLGELNSDEGGFYQLFFSPDGKRLASEGLSHSIQNWDLATHKELNSWQLPFGWVQAFSPDGRTVAVGGRRGPGGTEPDLVLCDLASGRQMRRFSGIKANHCAFSADGRLLAVDADPWYQPDRERTIQVLELASGKVRARFAGHFGFPGQIIFSADGRMLATGSSDTTALIWDMTGRMGGASETQLRKEDGP